MAEHEKVMGICYPNKCYIEVPTKKAYDVVEGMVNDHEERLDDITKEVDGDLNCKTVKTSGNITSGGTITSTGKINANGGLAVTSLTASGTITATGIINANGGIKIPGDIVGNLKGNVTGNVTGSISGGTVAGSTGTFSGVVTAKNINKFGYIPTTLALLGTTTPEVLYTNGGYPTYYPSAYADAGKSLDLYLHSGTIQASKSETKEVKVLPVMRLSDYIYLMINEIKVVGSWSISMCHTNTSGKLTVYLNGTKLTNAGTTITAAKALELLSSINTVKLVNSDTASYQNTQIKIIIKNTGTARQYIRDYPIGFY